MINLDDDLPEISNVNVQIVRAQESSGNVQFFLRAVRSEANNFNMNGLLEYQCFQTKNGKNIQECIDDAIFGSTFLLRFFGKSAKDLMLVGFCEEELGFAQTAKEFWRMDEV